MPPEDDPDDYASQPTVVLQAASTPRELIVQCQFCLMEYNAIFGLGRMDAQRDPLGICQQHLRKLSLMMDEEYNVAMDVQYHAVWRWAHPFAYGERE
jgi:hypothetical protein